MKITDQQVFEAQEIIADAELFKDGPTDHAAPTRQRIAEAERIVREYHAQAESKERRTR